MVPSRQEETYRCLPCLEEKQLQGRRTRLVILVLFLDPRGLLMFVNIAAHGGDAVLGQHIHQPRFVKDVEQVEGPVVWSFFPRNDLCQKMGGTLFQLIIPLLPLLQYSMSSSAASS